MSVNKNDSTIVFGLILIVIGVIFLLNNFYAFELRYIIFTYWPSILIILGAVKMIQSRDIANGPALILLAIGIVFQAIELNMLYRWQVRRYWPVLLILLGGWLIFRHRKNMTSLENENSNPDKA